MDRGTVRFGFLDILRGSASLLVVWDHIFSIWPHYNNISIGIVSIVQTYVNKPLGLIQDFGWLGVVLFFLISGFVITHVAQRETPREFITKRIFRIYPALSLAVLVSVALTPSLWEKATPSSIISNMVLVNYVMVPQVVLLGVAWTLAIEMIFYVLVLLLFPLRTSPTLSILGILTLTTSITYFSKSFGNSFFLFAVTASYVPYLITGQIFYFLLHAKSVRFPTAILLLALTYASILYGISSFHPHTLPVENSYLLSYVFASAIFLLAFAANDQMKPGRIITILSDHSYALYLFHGAIGFWVLDRLVPVVGFYPAVLVALTAIAVAVGLVHAMIEKPMLTLARKVLPPKASRGSQPALSSFLPAASPVGGLPHEAIVPPSAHPALSAKEAL